MATNANTTVPPVPPLSSGGFQDPTWQRWFNLLRAGVAQVITNANLTIATANGFSGTVTAVGTSGAQITLSTTVNGLLKGAGGSIVAASAGTDYVQSVAVTAPITNSGSAAAPNIGHANSGVTAGTYTKVTVNGFGHVTVGAALTGSDITTALGFTPLNPSNNLSDVVSPSVARANLAVPGLATSNSYTGSNDFTGGAATVPTVGPTSNSTTAASTAWVRSAMTNNPPPIGTINPNSGGFTTLAASGNDALLYQNGSAQSIPTGTVTVVTGWTLVSNRLSADFNPTTGVFTAPVTGIYNISATLCYNPTAQAVGNLFRVVVIGNGVTLGQHLSVAQTTTPTLQSCSVSCVASLAAGQTITINAVQNTAGAVPLHSTATLNMVSVSRIP